MGNLLFDQQLAYIVRLNGLERAARLWVGMRLLGYGRGGWLEKDHRHTLQAELGISQSAYYRYRKQLLNAGLLEKHGGSYRVRGYRFARNKYNITHKRCTPVGWHSIATAEDWAATIAAIWLDQQANRKKNQEYRSARKHKETFLKRTKHNPSFSVSVRFTCSVLGIGQEQYYKRMARAEELGLLQREVRTQVVAIPALPAAVRFSDSFVEAHGYVRYDKGSGQWVTKETSVQSFVDSLSRIRT